MGITSERRERNRRRSAASVAASRRAVIKTGLIAALGAGTAWAAQDSPDDKPFADHHLALQLSDREPAKRALVLSVTNNVLKAYGPDKVAIEIVAFGPGIELLRAHSPDRQAVDSLVSQGVRFDVCMNTVETLERETGKRVALNPHAQPVTAGVVQLLALAEHGYTVVRP
jgi:intracellular sulfur oxidation DsrE/DsrF family protein